MATIADIAKRAGVSVSTVSYVLSGKRPISEPTKERVRAAIDELAFRPHALGRALASRRTRTIALLFPAVAKGLSELELEFFTAAAAAAGERGYLFVLSTAPVEADELHDLTRSGSVDGLILMEVRLHDPRVELLREGDFPFALIGHCQDNAGLSFVDLDFAHAVAAAVDHLSRLGHRRVVLVDGATDLPAIDHGPAVRSRAGFERAIAAHGIAGEVVAAEASHEAGQVLARRFANASPAPTAAVVVNRELLGGLVAGTYDRGRRIPEDLSFVAILPQRLARLFTPTLTAIDFPVAQMGRLGAEMLIRRLEGGEEQEQPEHHLLRGELVIGRSTARPRRQRRPTLAPVG